ncbi:MAG TPA: polysaccharide lyase [Pseudonocardia sp.]|nr:polysaccharide lyase [Pseudonocardia sp.]
MPAPPSPAVPQPLGVIPPAAGAVPGVVGSNVLFVGDYETGDLTQWDTCQSRNVNSSCANADPYSTQLMAVGARQGAFATRFVVRDGDVPEFGGGERAEVSTHHPGAMTREGDERWYQWSMYLPEGFRHPGGWWFIVMQWHAGHGSPPLEVGITPEGNVALGGLGGTEQVVGPVRTGQWVDYTLHVRFANSASSGFVEAWENGVQTVPLTPRATMNSAENYLKQGIYRDDQASGTSEVWLDGLVVSAP